MYMAIFPIVSPRAKSYFMYNVYSQEHMMTSFLLQREEEERVTSYSGRGESRISRVYYSTSGRVEASVRVNARVKVSAKYSSWGLMGWISTVRYPRRSSRVWLKGYAVLFDCLVWIGS